MLKCPCCGQLKETEFLCIDREFHYRDGRILRVDPKMSKYLNELINRGYVQMEQDTKTSNPVAVYMSRIRVFFVENALPYSIETDRHTRRYLLKKVHRHVQNDHAPERPEDIHS